MTNDSITVVCVLKLRQKKTDKKNYLIVTHTHIYIYNYKLAMVIDVAIPSSSNIRKKEHEKRMRSLRNT